MSTVISHEKMGSYAKVSTTDPDVIHLLLEAGRGSYGREARRDGVNSKTFWCSQAVIREVKVLVGIPL